MIPNIGPLEIAILVVIALVIFGPKRLPELGRSAGKSLREFRSSIAHEEDEEPEAKELSAPAAASVTPIEGDAKSAREVAAPTS